MAARGADSPYPDLEVCLITSSIALRAIIAGSLSFLSCMLPAMANSMKTKAGAEASVTVRKWIDAGKCDVAVDRLKTGLKDGHPEVMLLAGSLYENGVCLRRDWSKAVTFYAQAFEGGLAEGAERLAAGYADPANGADVAAALWWAGRGRGSPARMCRVSEDAAADPDRFVAELATWPQDRLALCNYVAGIMATIAAEVKYPELAMDYAVGGDVTLRFLADIPRIELRKGESREYQLLGWVDGDALRDRRSSSISGGFDKALGDVAQRALRRYPQPKGIPAGTVVETIYQFSVSYEKQ